MGSHAVSSRLQLDKGLPGRKTAATIRAVIVDDQRPGPTNAGDWPPQMLSLTPIGVLGTGDDGSSWFGARRLGSEVATATPGGEA